MNEKYLKIIREAGLNVESYKGGTDKEIHDDLRERILAGRLMKDKRGWFNVSS